MLDADQQNGLLHICDNLIHITKINTYTDMHSVVFYIKKLEEKFKARFK